MPRRLRPVRWHGNQRRGRGLLANKLFSPTTLWSASRLEQYRGCPYKFFLQYVLQIWRRSMI